MLNKEEEINSDSEEIPKHDTYRKTRFQGDIIY